VEQLAQRLALRPAQQHLVRLVEHDVTHATQGEARPAVLHLHLAVVRQDLEQPLGRRHQHVTATVHLRALLAERVAAREGAHAKAQVVRQRLGHQPDLHGQSARGRQDERAGIA